MIKLAIFNNCETHLIVKQGLFLHSETQFCYSFQSYSQTSDFLRQRDPILLFIPVIVKLGRFIQRETQFSYLLHSETQFSYSFRSYSQTMSIFRQRDPILKFIPVLWSTHSLF